MSRNMAIPVLDTDTDSVLQRLQTMTEYLNLRGYRVTFYTNKDGYAKIPSGIFPRIPDVDMLFYR